MKWIKYLTITLLISTPAWGQPLPSDLMGLGMPAALASLMGQGGWDQNLVFKDVSAGNTYSISAGTSDADDDATVSIAGGGSNSSSRGAAIFLHGNEDPTSGEEGDVRIKPGDASGAHVEVLQGDVEIVSGNIDLAASGTTLVLEDGTAASSCIGSATLNATTAVTVSTTCIATGDYVFVTRTASATADEFYVDNIVNGTSFDLTSEAGDTGTVSWIIIKGQ